MSQLITIDTDPDFTPKDAVPTPERLISGNPFFKTWAQDASKGEKVLTGVWEATPGEHHLIKGTTYEFCHIISGLVEIEEKGGAGGPALHRRQWRGSEGKVSPLPFKRSPESVGSD
ncbi:cupin domain-containing protein [Mesorhizobium abyssinicae]|uniref:Cupin domain-containing protein n=1 Tax=Mesorhizobium abyssinicae TaxID=1209958 RepID=A0ABU5AFE9_9HYPH|nr:cupin domain-containing protein [Mesorhizobium abyssinicae]MDX8536014.1 cupin domain-containing protein [Mesorhizobium abyssinicae]